MRLLIECDKMFVISLRRLLCNVNNVYYINVYFVVYKLMKQQSFIVNCRYVVDRRVISIVVLNKYVLIIVKNFLGCKLCEM